MIRTRLSFTLAPLALLMMVMACSDGGESISPEGSTTVALLLTDAPGDHVDNVWIDIGEISLQGTGGKQVLFTPDEGESLGLVNLAELDDETLSLAEGVVVPEGSYGQMRFVVNAAVLEAGGKFYSMNGAVPPEGDLESFEADGDLMCPSCSQSGLKVLLPHNDLPLAGEQTVVVLDFDIARSFGRAAGGSGKWVMSPIIVATELGFSGGTSGTVSLAEGVSIPECPTGTERDLSVFAVTATARTLVDENGDPVVYTTHPDPGGSITFDFLVPDTYDVGFATPVEVTETHQISFVAIVTPSELTIQSGVDADVDVTIESAVCEEIPTS
jgi:hypothetical protein